MHACVRAHMCMNACGRAHMCMNACVRAYVHMQVYRTRSSTRGFKKDVRQADIHSRARGVGACADGGGAVKELDAVHAAVGGT